MQRRAAERLQRPGERQRPRQVPAARHPVGGRHAHPDGCLRHRVADRLEHLQGEPHPVLETPAIVVVAAVGEGGQELVQQVAVRRVQLDPVQSEPGRATRRGGKIVPDRGQARPVERGGRVFSVPVRQWRGRHRLPAAGRVGRNLRAALPRDVTGRLAAGMGELDRDGHLGMGTDRGQHPGQGRLVGVGVQTQVLRRDPRLRGDGAGLQDQQPRPGQRQVTQMDHVPVGGGSVLGRVLAHGRNDDSIGEGQPAQIKRLEQVAHHVVLQSPKRTCRIAEWLVELNGAPAWPREPS